jgi:hypothetical protein
MSDLNNRDPYNPTPPIAPGGPTPGGAYDQYGNSRFEPVEPSGRGPYVLLGLLVAIGIIGGLVYFNHAPRTQQTAQAPISSTTTRPAPAPMNAPVSPTTTPTSPATTSPAAPSTPSANPAPAGDVTK